MHTDIPAQTGWFGDCQLSRMGVSLIPEKRRRTRSVQALMTNLSDFVFNSEFLFLEVSDGDIVWVWAVVFFVNRDFQGLMLRFQGLNLLLKVHERTLLTLMIVADHSGILIGSQPPKYGNSIRFKNLHSPGKTSHRAGGVRFSDLIQLIFSGSTTVS